jgi:1-acyl-sn-glycerol-3-phosphate acyltransferase
MIAALCGLVLRLIGWKFGPPPPLEVKKLVVIAGPHTSNWDYVLMMLYVTHWGMKIRWMGKQSLFEGPLGWLLRKTGGIGIDRSQNHNTVDAMAAEFGQRDHLWLVIPAEGTRGYRDSWKSGFYTIAQKAGVPIAPSYLDYARREAGFPPLIDSSGDARTVMDQVRAVYGPVTARFPDKKSRIHLRLEDEEAASGDVSIDGDAAKDPA